MSRRIDSPDTPSDIALRHYLESEQSFVMISGAGSGKTTSLVKALAYLRKHKGELLRAKRQKIACITYTEVAAGEVMAEVGEDSLFHVSTIHSFLWTVVRPFQTDIRRWVLRRIDEKIVKLEAERAAFGRRTGDKKREETNAEIADLQDQRGKISTVPAFKYASGTSYSKGVLGHDDVIKMATTLIAERPLLRSIIAQGFPFVFIDESQDTFETVVSAFKSIESQEDCFCLGFFGDPMQKIYTTGIGLIPLGDGWAEIKKPENFRCPKVVLDVINRIRSAGDGLQQVLAEGPTESDGPKKGPGTARLFVLPSSDERAASLGAVRKYLRQANNDELWTTEGAAADLRVLVLEHSMAANRLGFPTLHQAFNADASENFKTGFREGTLWALAPFLSALLPLVDASNTGNRFEVLRILRSNAPALDRSVIQGAANPDQLLAGLKTAINSLAETLSKTNGGKVGHALAIADKYGLVRLDERLLRVLVGKDTSAILPEADESALKAFFECPAHEVSSYRRYVERNSPYATHQGVKGAEFTRVLVVLDDEESRHRQFSFGKLIGTEPPSRTDISNKESGEDTVQDRTRRLFYVCCSRALQDLVVVCYAADVTGAVAKFREAGMFQEGSILTKEVLE